MELTTASIAVLIVENLMTTYKLLLLVLVAPFALMCALTEYLFSPATPAMRPAPKLGARATWVTVVEQRGTSHVVAITGKGALTPLRPLTNSLTGTQPK